jgi:invasion protein IalB
MAMAVALFAALGVAQGQAQTRLQKNFDKWIVACVQPEGQSNQCTLAQNFEGQNQKTGQRFFAFSWSIAADPEGERKVRLRTPLGVKLIDKISIQFPGSDPLAVDYTVCTNIGCFAEFTFQKVWFRMLTENPTVTISYMLINDRKIDVKMELAGFSDAYAYFIETSKQ